MMQHQNLSLLILGTLGMSLVYSCGSSSTPTKPVTETIRTGRANSSIEPQYFDAKPSLDSSGTKIVFTSGRDGGTSKIYKSSFSSGVWEGPTKVSTATQMTSENIAKLSPDGNWVLIEGAISSGKTLSLCSFSAGTCTTVTGSVWGQGNFGFSPNSSLFFIMSGTKSSGATVYFADVSTPTTLNQLSGQDQWIEGFWASNSSPFTFITSAKSSTAGKKSLHSRSITTAASAASAVATTFATEISYGAALDYNSASSNYFTFTAPRRPSIDKIFTELGSTEDANKKSIPLRNEIQIMSATGTIDTTATSQPGFETTQAFLSSDDSSLFTLNRIAVRCSGDADSTFGFSMAIVNRSDGAITWKHLKKPSDLATAPTFSTDPCDKTLNDGTTTYDFAPADVDVNSSATASSYVMAWASDMGGDPEVYVASTSSGTTTIANVSVNRKP